MEYRVLVVDDDETCLNLLKACLEKWNYQVTTVKHALEALSMLRMESYDLVLSDVYMPDINGFELLRQVNQEFNLPVILMSADTSPEVMFMGMKNGAQCFLVKPIEANDLKDIWQYALWWKRTKNNSTDRITQINESSGAGVAMSDHHNDGDNNFNDGDTLSSAALNTAGDDATEAGRKNKRFVWTSDLHSRFVEAILVIGYQEAVPANIYEVMNVPGVTRGQVASHLQKYQKFLKRVLDGTTHIEFSDWIDLAYSSSVVPGNPDLLLINQLKEAQRNGKLAAYNPLRPPRQENITTKVRAPNGSSSSGQYRLLPPYTTRVAASSNMSEPTILMPNNSAYSSTNVASQGQTNATLLNAYNENMSGIVGGSTSNSINNQFCNTNQMGYYYQNTPAQELNNYSETGGLIGGAMNNLIPSENNVTPSGTAPLWNNFYSQPPFIVGGRGNNNFDYGINFNTDQLGSNHGDPSLGISFDVNHLGSTSAMNGQQLGGTGEQITDGSWFHQQ